MMGCHIRECCTAALADIFVVMYRREFAFSKVVESRNSSKLFRLHRNDIY